VRALRKNRGYSLDDLAARSGVSRASLSQIETAKTNPTIQRAVILAPAKLCVRSRCHTQPHDAERCRKQYFLVHLNNSSGFQPRGACTSC
jgi:transcriptional regulator with XRE-family HTH domain